MKVDGYCEYLGVVMNKSELQAKALEFIHVITQFEKEYQQYLPLLSSDETSITTIDINSLINIKNSLINRYLVASEALPYEEMPGIKEDASDKERDIILKIRGQFRVITSMINFTGTTCGVNMRPLVDLKIGLRELSKEDQNLLINQKTYSNLLSLIDEELVSQYICPKVYGTDQLLMEKVNRILLYFSNSLNEPFFITVEFKCPCIYIP